MNVGDLIDELAGGTCRCGKAKKAMQSFCKRCYFKLPPRLRTNLYERVGRGYEQAYEQAIEHLGLADPKKAATEEMDR